jgi:hypothetical protein
MGAVPQSGSGQEDPELGTWTLNPAKSRYQPGPPLKSQTRTVEKADEGQRLRNVTTTSEGTKVVVGYTAKFDGIHSTTV